MKTLLNQLTSLLTKPIMGFLLMVLFGLYSQAQDQQSQIKVKITKEINGEQQTYEGSYDSEAQMKADERLQEFMGDDEMTFGFSNDESMDPFGKSGSGNHHFFFNFDDEEEGMSRHFRMLHPDDSVWGDFDVQMKKLSEQLGEMDIDLKKHLEQIHNGQVQVFGFGDDLDFDWSFPDSIGEDVAVRFKRLQDEDGSFDKNIHIIVRKTIEITEKVGEEFGKKGTVSPKNQLELTDLTYYPNPSSNGRFKLRFETPGEGELSIKVFNLEGREIFNRYFERFNGLYSETIDLSGQNEGLYLLEIQQDGKRLTRKIMIN